MSSNRFRISEAISKVAAAIHFEGADNTPTGIRCAINDLNDAAEKGGMEVHHDYNQERAIAKVRKIVDNLRTADNIRKGEMINE